MLKRPHENTGKTRKMMYAETFYVGGLLNKRWPLFSRRSFPPSPIIGDQTLRR